MYLGWVAGARPCSVPLHLLKRVWLASGPGWGAAACGARSVKGVWGAQARRCL